MTKLPEIQVPEVQDTEEEAACTPCAYLIQRPPDNSKCAQARLIRKGVPLSREHHAAVQAAACCLLRSMLLVQTVARSAVDSQTQEGLPGTIQAAVSAAPLPCEQLCIPLLALSTGQEGL